MPIQGLQGLQNNVKVTSLYMPQRASQRKLGKGVTRVTMGGDLQPGSLADRLLTGLGQPQINP